VQCDAVWFRMLQCAAVAASIQRLPTSLGLCCSVLQRVAACCSSCGLASI